PGGADNRISYGCINVPAPFYATVIRPLFESGEGIVYVLPETRSMEAEFFGPTAEAEGGT
ncbi:MAG: L,D-transpeptidase, partial [Brevundimonas sp.]